MFAAVWLVFLIYPLEAGWEDRDTIHGWVGIVGTIAFGAAYVGIFGHIRAVRNRLQLEWRPPNAALLLGGLCALSAILVGALGQDGSATFVYLAAASMMMLPTAAAFVFSVLMCVGNEVATRTLDSWSGDGSLTFAIFASTIAMWGVQQMIARNLDLIRAKEENLRLAVSEERNRFARDLHDILGHSLTVITVKAELAQRLLDLDADRTRSELADLERLSREALADVRRAVEGYRDLTLPGELARARMALEAAGITADLPNSTDEVAGNLRELFAWAVREGVTNVIRHSGATTCAIRLTPRSAEILDDGNGPSGQGGDGSGLVGLRERASVVNASVVTQVLEPAGFSLKVVSR